MAGEIVEAQDGGADYLVTVRIRNNRILRRMHGLGIHTVAELCRRMGRTENGTQIGLILNMKISGAKEKSGKWREVVWQLSSALRCEPEDLFNERQRAGAFAKTSISFEATEDQLIPLDSPEVGRLTTDFVDPVEKAEFRAAVIERLSSCMSIRNTDIVMRRLFPVAGEPETLEEIAATYGLSKDRIRQIEDRGIRRLRNNKLNNPIMGWKKQ